MPTAPISIAEPCIFRCVWSTLRLHFLGWGSLFPWRRSHRLLDYTNVQVRSDAERS
jgi:hypothetical protein